MASRCQSCAFNSSADGIASFTAVGLELGVSSRRTTPGVIRGAATALAMKADYNFHVGCYYRDPETDSICLLHFARHGLVSRSRPSDEYVWATPALNFFDLTLIANHCAAIYERYESDGIAFSLAYRTRFKPDLALTLDGPQAGFTCATFVLAIFERAGVELLKADTWEPRDSDILWQQHVREYYAASGHMPQETLEQIQNDIGSVRYRPQEVLAATTCRRYPVPFKKARPIAERIVKFMKQLNRPLQ